MNKLISNIDAAFKDLHKEYEEKIYQLETEIDRLNGVIGCAHTYLNAGDRGGTLNILGNRNDTYEYYGMDIGSIASICKYGTFVGDDLGAGNCPKCRFYFDFPAHKRKGCIFKEPPIYWVELLKGTE